MAWKVLISSRCSAANKVSVPRNLFKGSSRVVALKCCLDRRDNDFI